MNVERISADGDLAAEEFYWPAQAVVTDDALWDADAPVTDPPLVEW